MKSTNYHLPAPLTLWNLTKKKERGWKKKKENTLSLQAIKKIIYIYVCMCVCVCVYTHIYIYVCVCVCVCVYTHIYIHVSQGFFQHPSNNSWQDLSSKNFLVYKINFPLCFKLNPIIWWTVSIIKPGRQRKDSIFFPPPFESLQVPRSENHSYLSH